MSAVKLIVQRVRSIAFPARRNADGSPLVPLSVDYFKQLVSTAGSGSGSSTSSPVYTNIGSINHEAPRRYARKPVTDMEMEAILTGCAW
eukprot:CFRG0847T1